MSGRIRGEAGPIRGGAGLLGCRLTSATAATAILFVLLSTVACGPETPPLPSEGTLAMAERLSQLREGADSDAFFAPSKIEALRSQEPLENPRRELQRRFRIARLLLLAGRTQEAVDELEALAPDFEAQAHFVRAPFLERWRHTRAIAWMRLAEERNCVDGHNPDSCLMPIRGDGAHQWREGSERALELYRDILARNPDDLNARWLLNLAAMTLGQWPEGIAAQYRIAPAAFESSRPEGRPPLPRMRDVAPALGVDVTALSGGVVTDDLDGDGWLDILVSSWGSSDALRLFLADGAGGFEDHSASAGLDGIVGGLNLVHADLDNDGDIDVLVLRGAWAGRQGRLPSSLLLNRGDATFDDATEAAGLLDYHPGQTAAMADFDGDGWLDIFLGYESAGQERHPCRLMRNLGATSAAAEGQGIPGPVPRFEDITTPAEAQVGGFVKGVVAGDVDGDGWPDLYISRLLEPNILLRNRGDGTFEDITAKAGVAEPRHGFPAFFFDFDQDGDLDLLASAFSVDFLGVDGRHVAADYLGLPTEAETPRLYRNRGDGTFDDISQQAGLDRVLYTMGSNIDDLDGDGWPDLYLGTGAPDFRALMPNRFFHNDSGKRFLDATTDTGLGHLQKGHGVAFADFDQDGDLDIYTVLGGAYSGDIYPNALFENPGHHHGWLSLELEGTDSNRSAIGARVRVDLEAKPGSRNGSGPEAGYSVHRTVSTGGSFGSQSLRLEIGLGQAASVRRAEVRWPSKRAQTFIGLTIGKSYRLIEGQPAPIDQTRSPVSLAADETSGRLEKHAHPPGG